MFGDQDVCFPLFLGLDHVINPRVQHSPIQNKNQEGVNLVVICVAFKLPNLALTSFNFLLRPIDLPGSLQGRSHIQLSTCSCYPLVFSSTQIKCRYFLSIYVNIYIYFFICVYIYIKNIYIYTLHMHMNKQNPSNPMNAWGYSIQLEQYPFFLSGMHRFTNKRHMFPTSGSLAVSSYLGP